MSESVPVALWYFIGCGAIAHAAVPLLLRDLRLQYPALFDRLGNPTYRQMFSRYPGHWKLQFRFLRFLASGEALRTTNGRARILAGIAACAFAGILLSFAALGVAISRA